MHKVLPLTLLVSQLAMATPAALKKGDPAPFDGVIFTTEEEKNLRNIAIDKEYYEKLLPVVRSENQLLEEKVKVWMKQSQELAETNAKLQNDSFWKKAAMFAGGAAVTVLLTFAVKGATK